MNQDCYWQIFAKEAMSAEGKISTSNTALKQQHGIETATWWQTQIMTNDKTCVEI